MYRQPRASLTLLGAGLTALLAAACSSDDDGGGEQGATQPDPIQVVPVERETCDDNPLLVECLPQQPSEPDRPASDNTPPRRPDPGDPAELARAAAENVLAANCGQCHGPALTEQQALAGMNYIDDIERLVETGKIVPLNSAASRVVLRMSRGEMPPPSSGLPSVTDADIAVVSQYIDNPRFWPDYAQPNCSGDGELVDFDDLYGAVARDLARADNEDAPFLRYISLTNRVTAGVCSDALDRDRQALTKMLNMLSIRARVGQPEPVDSDATIYRIDLRDFDWDRAIEVNGRNFDDVWEAIAENNPYAVEFVGDDADDAKDDAETAFPVMFADQMLDVAVLGNLYYAIIGVDVDQPLSDFIAGELGIDVQQNLDDEDVVRAGTTRSRISRQDRVVERHDIEVRNGVLWQSFDFDDQANESIFEDPFGFAAGGTEVIFTLPNGMLGYIIADEDDNIVEDSDILLDTNQNNFRAVTAVSCSNCHASGFIPVVDEVKDISLRNARSIGLNRDEIEQLEAIYVSPQQFARQVQEDTSNFYQRALQAADLPIQGGDPVSATFLRFDADVELSDAAGDLGVLPEELEDTLGLLDPVLSVLRRGTLDRDDFTQVYIASLCVLSSPLENRPDDNICDDALRALD